MNLKPLFSGETQAESAKTIDENLANIAGRLFSTPSAISSERIRLLEIAVQIGDAETRGDFVGLVNRLKFLEELQVEAHEAIGIVRKQLARVV